MKKRTEDEIIIILKSVFYRLWGTITTIAISYIFTGDFKVSIGIGVFEIFSKTILYYVYEKLWGYFIKKYKKKNVN